MMRLSFLFATLLTISALSLVTARFQSRQLFVKLDRLEDKARQLDTDWRRLQLERAELQRNVRVDQSARQDLGMKPATPDRTLYVEGPQTVSAPGAGKAGRP
ncbi:cell division protein FtsL [Allopusillimonas ginsengisoli]|uniref:cell division protein FtsL n=1 Tax=Allopusillimonas ginsengisoli TaxID=453575 RepID=UPI0010C23CB4|nr:cell division protein FtsL [Allopusillimonas ginsengisoli]